MEIEDIDDNSSQDALCPAATILPAKKRTNKTKKDSKKKPIAHPSSTLTRFLGPRGAPSTSVWEDADRQCPVCQQGGFSSRSLALHVNECLDGRNVSRADAGESTARPGEQGQEATTAAVLAGAAQGQSNPSSCSARTAGERAGRTPNTGGDGIRQEAGRVSRESSTTTKSGTTGVVVVDDTWTGERVRLPNKTPDMAAKTASTRQGPSRTTERSGASLLIVGW